MTREDAIEYLSQCVDGCDRIFDEAVEMAVFALRAQAEEEKNEPLTLEELREMDGEPVWVKVLDHSVFADKADDFCGWGLVRKSWVRVWDERRADLVHIDYHFEEYGKVWLAYRCKPEEEKG